MTPLVALVLVACAPEFLDPIISGQSSVPAGDESLSQSGGGAGTMDDGGMDPGDDATGTGSESAGEPVGGCPGGEWTRVGESPGGSEEVRGLAVDAASNVVMVGDFDGDSLDLGAGPMDSAAGNLFVVKYGPDGEALWARQFGGPSVRGADVVFDATGDVVVIGTYWGHIDLGEGVVPASSGGPGAFVLKLSAAGETMWSRTFTSDSVSADTLAAHPGGDVVLALSTVGAIEVDGLSLGGAEMNAVILRLDDDGGLVWGRAFVGAFNEGSAYWLQLAFDPAGAVLAGGHHDGVVDFGAGPNDVGAALPLFVAKLDPGGALEWVRHSVSDGFPYLAGLASDSAGRIHLAGSFSQTVSLGGPTLTATAGEDTYAALLDGDGQHLWSEAYGSGMDANQAAWTMVANDAGERLVAGKFSGGVDFGGGALSHPGPDEHGFIVRQGPLGEHRWSRSLGGAGYVMPVTSAIDAAGSAWVAGLFNKDLIVGEEVFPASGATRIFLTKMCGDEG